ncbi:MAG: type II toxin-antitoxin system RelE/ParE family toxin [Gammaproteobacteria bacterium]|nr:type II toxin-antitoxin system RelE/ParE family toxin [Gammaproteobacteria bacterium]
MAAYALSPAARADLEEIWDYTVGHWGETQAERYIRNIQRACEALGGGTLVSRSAGDIRAGYRKAAVGS